MNSGLRFGARNSDRHGSKDATMVHYSIIIPERDCGAELRRQLPRLRAELRRLGLPYEILCVDDGSSSATLAALAELLAEEPALRLLRLDAPAGTSTALSAGFAPPPRGSFNSLFPGGRLSSAASSPIFPPHIS